MKLLLNCEVSLSKKLRKLLGSSGSVTLIASELSEGKGMGKLILESDRNITIEDGAVPEDLQGETSIQFTPVDITHQMPPTVESTQVASIFSTTEQTNTTNTTNAATGPRTVIDRLAVTEAPEKEQVPHAMVPKEEVVTPKEFSELQNPQCAGFVTSLEELLGEIEVAKDKNANIDLDSISDPFKRAVAMEKKEKLEAIDRSAYVVQETAAVLTINDLGITLALNAPYNLANVSAKRLSESGELKGLIRSGMVKFINPDQIKAYEKKAAAGHKTYGLDVFDNHELAEASLASDIGGKETQIIASTEILDEADLAAPTEEESMMVNLTSLMNTPMPDTEGEQVVRTTAGVRSSKHSG